MKKRNKFTPFAGMVLTVCALLLTLAGCAPASGGKQARESIRADVEESAVPEPPEPVSTMEPNAQDIAAVTAADLVGPWHLAENEKDNATAMEAIPGAMEFGSSMEITSDGNISWYIGADGGSGTYTLDGNILSADMTNNFDGSAMKMEFTVEETDSETCLYTEYKGLLLCWAWGDGETGKGK